MKISKIIIFLFLTYIFTIGFYSIAFAEEVQEISAPTVEITPSRFELFVEPRGKSVQAIKITNHGKEILTLTATAMDWNLNKNGGLELLEGGTDNSSAFNWIRFNPRKFVIEPGKTQYLRFEVSAPPDVQPGEYRSSLILTTEDKYTMGDGFFYQPTFAILVYVNIPEVIRKGEIKEVVVKAGESGTYYIEGQILSTGNAHIRLAGEYCIEDNQGNLIVKGNLGKKVILPGRSEKFMVDTLTDLKVGEYRVKIIFNYLPAFYMEGKLDEYQGDKSLEKDFVFTIN